MTRRFDRSLRPDRVLDWPDRETSKPRHTHRGRSRFARRSRGRGHLANWSPAPHSLWEQGDARFDRGTAWKPVNETRCFRQSPRHTWWKKADRLNATVQSGSAIRLSIDPRDLVRGRRRPRGCGTLLTARITRGFVARSSDILTRILLFRTSKCIENQHCPGRSSEKNTGNSRNSICEDSTVMEEEKVVRRGKRNLFEKLRAETLV